MEDIIFLDGFPSQILCYGGVTPYKLARNLSAGKPERLILMLPGYPGSTKLYSRFAEELYKRVNIPIWLVGYLGCADNVHCPDAVTNRQNYELLSQVRLMKTVISRYLQDVRLVIWGHSLGAWLALQVINDEQYLRNIVKVLFMFPIVEVVEPTAVLLRAKRLSNWLLLYPRLLQKMAAVLNKIGFVSYMTNHKAEHIKNMITENNALPMTWIGLDCEKHLWKEYDGSSLQIIMKNKNKLKLYYCTKDEFLPETSCQNLKKLIPEIDASMDTLGLPHSFSLAHSEIVAELNKTWIEEIDWR